MKNAERLLWDLDHRLALQSIKGPERYYTNILLTRLFKEGYHGVINALNSYREALMLVPAGMFVQDPLEHSERGNYWCDVYSPTEIPRLVL